MHKFKISLLAEYLPVSQSEIVILRLAASSATLLAVDLCGDVLPAIDLLVKNPLRPLVILLGLRLAFDVLCLMST